MRSIYGLEVRRVPALCDYRPKLERKLPLEDIQATFGRGGAETKIKDGYLETLFEKIRIKKDVRGYKNINIIRADGSIKISLHLVNLPAEKDKFLLSKVISISRLIFDSDERFAEIPYELSFESLSGKTVVKRRLQTDRKSQIKLKNILAYDIIKVLSNKSTYRIFFLFEFGNKLKFKDIQKKLTLNPKTVNKALKDLQKSNLILKVGKLYGTTSNGEQILYSLRRIDNTAHNT